MGTHRIWLGRSREMAELEAGLDELSGRHGSLYLLTGEPGIGKSRLADELGRVATARGMHVHWGRAWEAGGAPVFWPFTQVLRSIARDSDVLATPAHTPIERFQLFQTVGELLRGQADVPRVIVLDDLHAADPSSLELLHFLVRDLRDLPVMLIGTYRDAEARLSAERSQLLARIAREGVVLPLRRLDRTEVAEFVALTTGRASDDERVASIFQQTEGNPLFLRELLRLHGASTRSTEGIREVVRARLALLEPDSRRLLEVAAVLGREFAVSPLAALAGITELDARSLVEPAANASVIESLDHPPRWRFTHVLLRQGLYDDLTDTRRCALHAAAAELAESRLDELAHHLVNAVPHVAPVRAARAALKAADRAIELLAFEDALELYVTAERLLSDRAEPGALFDAIYGSAHARMRMAEVHAGRVDCERAAEIARAIGDGERFARAILMATYELVPEIRDAALISALEEALIRLSPGDGALRARCLAQLAAQRHPEPDNGPRIELAREGLAMARRVGDAEALRLTLVGASIATTIYAPPDEAQAINQELLRLALAAGDKRVALRAQMFLAGIAYQRGDLQGAAAHNAAVGELLREFRHGRFAWVTVVLSVMEHIACGRFEQAATMFAAGDSAADQDQARGALFAAAPLAFACITERYDDRAQIEARVRATFGALGSELSGCLGELFIAQLHGRAGDAQRATAQLSAVTTHPMFAAIEEPAWLVLLADACYLAGDRVLAQRLYAKLLPRADQFGFLGPLTLCIDAPFSRALGLLAHTLGRLDDAVRHLEDAELRTRRGGLRAHLARLGFELARALVARARPADRERAAQFVTQARALATELGQVGLLDQFTDSRPAVPKQFAPPVFSIRRDGDGWLVECGDRQVRLRDSRGLQVLGQLVANPDHELHVLQLVRSGDDPIDAGDAGPLLDPSAVGSYRERLLELRENLDDAERSADLGRIERTRAEIEALTEELARGVGLGGRERRAGGAAERARTAIQKRLRDAIRKITDEIPDLGRHLEQTIHTGMFCGYLPNGRRR